MVVLLWAAVAVLLVAVLILSARLCLMKKTAAELAEGFADRLTEDTNVLLDISSRDKNMLRLAKEINRQLAALRRERQRFQQGDTELKEAVTNISHDLRTPLTAICGYLDLLKREDTSETAARYIAMIEGRTEALKSLTEELFRYSILISVNDGASERLRLNDILEESLLSFYGAMEGRGIHPTVQLPEDRVERTLNRSALSRVLDNILTNAIKYSDGDLSVSLSADGTIGFSNSAKRLSAVEVGKLFNRFFTVESGRGATGLGLSIARLLTERMGGTIAADYEDQTLRITLRFPPD